MFITSPEASYLGNFLTGTGTCAIAFGAWFQFRAWRKQQYHVKRAEVAGRALAAVIRLFQALDFLTSPVIDAPEDANEEKGPRKRSYRQRADFRKRLKVTGDDLQRFFDVKNESEVYLPDEVNIKLDEIWREWVSVKIDIGLHFDFIDSKAPRQDLERVYDTSFGQPGHDKRKRLEREIKALLKPIASLES